MVSKTNQIINYLQNALSDSRYYLSNKTIFEEQAYRSEKMAFDAAEAVTLVRIDLLFEQHTMAGQRLGQGHGLLKVHIVVGCAVHEQILFVAQLVHIVGQVTLFVALVVIRDVRTAHVAFGVC